MPTYLDRLRASSALEKMIQEIGHTPKEIIRNLVYNRADSEFTERYVAKRELIGKVLGWKRPGNRLIPDNRLIPFFVDVAESDLIALEGIRKLIVRYLLKTNPRGLQSILHKNIESRFENNIIESFMSIPVQMNSTFAKEICNLTGIPIAYSSKGTVSQTASHVLVNMPKPLPPLVDFQKNIASRLQDVFNEKNGRAIICMPTGSGKTRTTSEAALGHILNRSKWPFSILWVADQSELCEQATQSLIEVFQDFGIRENGRIETVHSLDVWRYFNGKNINSISIEGRVLVPGITITSVQQLRRRIDKGERDALALIGNSDIVIVDEAHRNLDWLEDFDKLLKSGENKPPMIGLSATPMRSEINETARLSKVFEQIFCPVEGGEADIDMMTRIMQDWGILSRRKDVDYSTLVNSAPNDVEAVTNIITNLISNHNSILVFAESVEHARNICAILNMNPNPIRAEYLYSETPNETRKRIISEFRKGQVNVLLNYGILTTGFDAPNTDAVVIARKGLDPQSSLFIQMVGRGLRGSAFGGTENCTVVHYRGV